MSTKLLIWIAAAALTFGACNTALPDVITPSRIVVETTTEVTPTPNPVTVLASPSPRRLTPTLIPATRPLLAPITPTPVVTLERIAWQNMPVVPLVSGRAREIFNRGLELGRNPRAFAKIGDCGSAPSWFLGVFDGPPDLYRLGDYGYLQETIDHFAGSFDRTSVASRPGFNISSIFSPLWSDPAECKSGEGPLICELRITNASYAFVMLGTNDVWHQDEFEPQLRRTIEDLIGRGVVPILATKADNLEQNHSLNAIIARLANEYDVPLWNFWAAVQSLPGYGLQDDGVHLTWAGNRFDDPDAMSRGWPMRNLTALQTLDAVWRGTTDPAR